MLPTLVLGAVSLFATADAKEDIQKEKAKLKGTWAVTSFELFGMKVPAQMKIIITDDQFAIVSQGGQPLGSAYQIDPSKKPATLDVVAPIGPKKGQINPGIYKLEGDILTLHQGGPGLTRPTQFASMPGSQSILMTLKREKP